METLEIEADFKDRTVEELSQRNINSLKRLIDYAWN